MVLIREVFNQVANKPQINSKNAAMSAKKLTKFGLLNLAVLLTLFALCLFITATSSAPANSATSTNNKSQSSTSQKSRLSIFSSLFKRGSGNEPASTTPSSTSSSSSSSQTSNGNDDESQMSDPEKEAQKFLDSVPNVAGNSGSREPSTFRERIGDTFGLLREGMSNQFRSWRENFSETVEDIRDTWSGDSSE